MTKPSPPPPVLMLPGTLCTGATFAAQRAALADRTAVTVRPLQGADSTEGYAEALLAAAPDRFALVGFSQGAIVALEIVRRAPERVARLALLALNPSPARPEQIETWSAWEDEARRDGLLRIAETMAGGVHASSRDAADLRRTVVSMALDTGVDAFIGQLRALAGRPDARPVLQTIRCPTLFLVGRDDPVTPLALQREAASRVRGARLDVIDACGHYAPLEQPAAVSDALVRWLER